MLVSAWLMNTMLPHLTWVFVNRSLCAECSAIRFHEYIFRIRRPISSELSRVPGHSVHRHIPKLATSVGKCPGSHQGNMSSSNLCKFASFLWKKTAGLYSLPFPSGKKTDTVTEPKSTIQTKQHCRRGQKIKRERSCVLRWPCRKEVPTHSGPASYLWAIIQREILESLIQTTVLWGGLFIDVI